MRQIITDKLGSLLRQARPPTAPIFKDVDFLSPHITVLDLTAANKDLRGFDLCDPQEMMSHTRGLMERDGAAVAIGRYDEVRTLYDGNPLFTGEQGPRCVHLGIDIMIEAGTSIHAPLDARVHSFQNNAAHGDYGPTIILEHEINHFVFYTLFGHLSMGSLAGIREGQDILSGQGFAEVGDIFENGNWPPHLHFQIITDMLGRRGDFFGVCSLGERDRYLALCPDPNLILNIGVLR